MHIVTHPYPSDKTSFLCAQSGCAVCLDHLLYSHERLIHAVVRQQYRGVLSYDDLIQEGRIALWQAILHYDPTRGTAFSTYAWWAIQRRIWSAVARAERPQGYLVPPAPLDPLVCAEAMDQQAAIQVALHEALGYLPQRLCAVLVSAYGLDGQPARTLAAIARDYGVTRECVRQWRNDALVLLRLPAVSGVLRRLCNRNDRQSYRQAEALNRAWLRQRRGGRR